MKFVVHILFRQKWGWGGAVWPDANRVMIVENYVKNVHPETILDIRVEALLARLEIKFNETL